jgi:hypothetical protein
MARTAQVTLSSKGLQMADRLSRKDFRFVSGSDALICDRFQAAFISPRIVNLLASDPSIDEFYFRHADSTAFELLIRLLGGKSVIIDEENADIFVSLIEELGNVELSETVMKFVSECDELNQSNCIFRLKQKHRLEVEIGRECDFIASHISEMRMDEIRGIEVVLVSNILKSESIRIPSEDWLLNFVLELGGLYSTLLGDIRFEYLSPSSIDILFKHISPHSIDDRLWYQLWNRCRHRIVYDSTDISDILWNRCPGFVQRSPDSAWSGLISHLTELCGGNFHTKGFVAVGCSSTRSHQCWDVVNYHGDHDWHTDNSANSWIQFDFKDRLISVTHYALKADGNTGCHLLQWTLQGSMDGHSWTDLDRRNTQELNGRYTTRICPCEQVASSSNLHFYRYIRLLQTGKDSSGYDYLMLGNFECFGYLMNLGNIGVIPLLNLRNS